MYAVPFDDIPAGLEVWGRFYVLSGCRRGGLRTYKYSVAPDVRRYDASSILSVVHFKYRQVSDIYTLTDEQWSQVQAKLQSLREDSVSKRKRSRRRAPASAENPYKRTTYQTRLGEGRSHTGDTTAHPDTARTDLVVGMRVRLYLEVSVTVVLFDCLCELILMCCATRIECTALDGVLVTSNTEELSQQFLKLMITMLYFVLVDCVHISKGITLD